MRQDLDLLIDRIARAPRRGLRRVVALAGPPASGKSTLGAALAEAVPGAQVVPMDGFHLDDRVLEARGLRQRKGAPETFDAAGCAHLVRRLATEPEVVHPIFDRAREIAIAGAGVVGPDCGTAIVEGNWLLLERDPWRGLRDIWDLTIRLDVPEEVLRARLTARWQGHGREAEAARHWIESNDLPNARTFAALSGPADIVLPFSPDSP